MLLHPAIAESGFAALGAARSIASTAEELPTPTVVAPDLLQRFAKISDGRRDQGRIHPVAVVLALCAGAVVAGMSSFTAIAGWVADVPRELLAQLYGHRSEPAPGPPSKATIWRVVTGADSAAATTWHQPHVGLVDDRYAVEVEIQGRMPSRAGFVTLIRCRLG